LVQLQLICFGLVLWFLGVFVCLLVWPRPPPGLFRNRSPRQPPACQRCYLFFFQPKSTTRSQAEPTKLPPRSSNTHTEAPRSPKLCCLSFGFDLVAGPATSQRPPPSILLYDTSRRRVKKKTPIIYNKFLLKVYILFSTGESRLIERRISDARAKERGRE